MTLKLYSKISIFFFVAVLFSACKSFYPIQHDAALIKANNSFPADTQIQHYYQPYKDSLDKIMKVTLAVLEEDLSKSLPESTLGNMMVDILKIKTEEYTKNKIDVAILNYGGIRMSSLTKGNLNVEQAYLLMPFDNYLVSQTLTGQQLSGFCDSIAIKNGWPIAGLSFKIKEHSAIDILVNNEPIDLAKNYNVALIDYVASGGDGMAFLKSLPQTQTGVLYREAIIEYWKAQTKLGNKISAKIENRITYAK